VAACGSSFEEKVKWCVPKYLQGYPQVKNCDGSWTEWGNLVAAPIER
jgi:thiosulfate/3-mercaptopyruvate sulfurtransferase